MTRGEQLVFCKKCLNRKMDMKQGLICELSGQKAAFENECTDFKIDETVKILPPDDAEVLQTEEIMEKLSPKIIEKLKMEQNLVSGVVAGLVVGIIGAVLWGVITVVTEFQIGLVAIAIGAGVGLTIRKFGNGIEKIFGFWGAGISLFSVLLGNFLSIVGFIANSEGLGYFETLLLIDYNYLPELMTETFDIKDLLFYGFAIYEGYRFSFRLITEKNLEEIKETKR